jgi:hypothetical protein
MSDLRPRDGLRPEDGLRQRQRMSDFQLDEYATATSIWELS